MSFRFDTRAPQSPNLALLTPVKIMGGVGEMSEEFLPDKLRTKPLLCIWRSGARPSSRFEVEMGLEPNPNRTRTLVFERTEQNPNPFFTN